MVDRPTMELRATDAERERAAHRLRTAAGEGCLTVDELEQRLAATHGAVTRADLADLVRDLPPLGLTAAPAPPQGLGADRSPAAVVLLTIVTFGIYLVFWWYQVNREMRDFARSTQPTHPLSGESPGTSTLALTLGAFLIVPVFITSHSTARRVGEAMTLAGLSPHDRPSPGLYMCLYTIGGLLFILPALFYAPLLQGHLNRAWQQARIVPQPGDWLTALGA